MLKSKPKLDPKVRFQNTSFKAQLQNARGYKRIQRRIPEKQWDVALSNLGLGSLKKRILSGVILALAVYMVYIPNLFYIKNIEVVGMPERGQAEISNLVREYSRQNILSAQYNLLLLSKKRLNDELNQRFDIQAVEKIEKDFPETLRIFLEPRKSAYLLETGLSFYSISEDGFVMEKIDAAATSTYNTLTRVIVSESESVPEGQKSYFPEHIFQYLNLSRQIFSDRTGLHIDYFKVEDLKNQEVIIYTSGYRILLSTFNDLEKSLSQLRLVLGNIEPAKQKNLAYIDMRYKDKGYACYLESPCAQETVFKPFSEFSTSTASSTLPQSN